MLRALPPWVNLFLEQLRLLYAAWILTSDWIKLRGSHARNGCYVTCCKTNLLWVSRTRNMYRFSAKSRTALLFQQQLFATWFVARQVWFEGGKTRNIVIPFVLQQCFETSSTFFLSVLSRPFLHVYRVAGFFWWSALHPLTKTFKCQTGKWWRHMKEIVTLFFVFLIQWQKCMQMKVSTRLKEAFDRWHIFKVSQNR